MQVLDQIRHSLCEKHLISVNRIPSQDSDPLFGNPGLDVVENRLIHGFISVGGVDARLGQAGLIRKWSSMSA